ncbi:MAG: HEAT repeat domain-containing protein, partial [Polyangia bacterium]
GDDVLGTSILASLARKPPLPALLMPVVLRDRAVALLYADNDGAELEADVVAELSTLTAAAARSFQRLILRAKGGEYAKAAPVADTRLSTSESAEGMASGGDWRRPTGEGGEPRARSTQPRFSVALVNAVKDELQTGNAMRSREGEPAAGTMGASADQRAANAPRELHDAPTEPLRDVEGLWGSVERQDEHASMSADALVAIGERASTALVARLPGPLRLDRHTLRGATPALSEHGPLLAVLQRMGRTARDPLLTRLGDSSLEVRYYATLALGELRSHDVVAPLGTRLYDPDAGVRRAAVEALARFPDSPELLALVEQMRGELPGPDGIRQRYAAEALGMMKDVTSVPRLIELVKNPDPLVVAAARKALVEITKQDFGTSRWRWRSWWERHRDQPRVEWMLDGLAHAEADVRLSAAEELRELTPKEFGYTFDAPKREREESRKKWVDWVRSHPPKQQDRR